MAEVNFEYLCVRNNKYVEKKDTEQICLENIDFTLTLKNIFEILKEKHLNYKFKNIENYFFIYEGNFCDINKSLISLNIPENGSIMMLNNNDTSLHRNLFLANLFKIVTDFNWTPDIFGDQNNLDIPINEYNLDNQVINEVGSFKKEGFLGVLYGGSVDSFNSRQILPLKDVQGLLIGGASLECKEFCNIVLGSN